MRGIHKIGCDYIVDLIASNKKCECFYQDVFNLFGLVYDNETIKQKRVFVATVTEYFIFKKCTNIKKLGNDEKYTCGKSPKNKKDIEKAINQYFDIRQECINKQDLMSKYAQIYNEDVRDFSEEISINRDDMLSDFAKAVEQLYHSKGDEQS